MAIAVHPCNPNIILAGSMFAFSDGKPGKLLRSGDGGKNWDTLRVGGTYIQVLFDPDDPRTAYASVFPALGASNSGILKSTDGGNSWAFTNEGLRLDSYTGVSALAIDPEDHRVLYAGTNGRFGGWLYRSDNGGRRWVPVDESEENQPLANGINEIIFDPNDPKTMYLGTAISGHLLKSVDRGRHWNLTGLGFTGWLVEDALVRPGNSSIIYAAITLGGVFQSRDGGDTWEEFNAGLPDSVGARKLVQGPSDAEIYLFAFNPAEGGWVYELIPATSTWSKLGPDQLHQPQSYGAVDLFFDKNHNALYFGVDGVYRIIDRGGA